MVSQAPIPVQLVPGDGGIFAFGSINGSPAFPLLVDTGTVLTTHGNGSGSPSQVQETLTLIDRASGGGPGVARGTFTDVQILEAQLAPVGANGDRLDLSSGGILGGDLLQQFSLLLDYSGPTLSLLPGDLSCSCAVDASCGTGMPFILAGGGTLELGSEVLTYPPTRVTLDACLQPGSDPLARGQHCISVNGGVQSFNQAEYSLDGSPGVDVKLLVATGFGGILLGASAWDRVNGAGAAAALSYSDALWFAGHADPLPAARAQLGTPAGRAAMAVVERLGLLGACGELNRSRRLRAYQSDPASHVGATADCNASDTDCPTADQVSCLQCLAFPGAGCTDAGGQNRCNDRNQPAAGYLELAGPIDVWVVADDAPILQEVNFDVRPGLPDVEGVVGIALLERLSVRIDYPTSRVLARCRDGEAGCATFSAFHCPDKPEVNDCGLRGQSSEALCNPPSAIPVQQPVGDGGVAPLCLPSPVDRDMGT
jgi:hypothetical protein